MSFDNIYNDLKNIDTPQNLTKDIIKHLLAHYNIEEVFYILKEKYKIDIELKLYSSNNQEETISPYQISINIARNDEDFKRDVKDRFQSCIICGYNKSICQVAHIYDFSKCKENIDECYDPENGLLLCPNHHILFDNGYLKLNEINDPTNDPNNNIEVKIDFKMLRHELQNNCKKLKLTPKNLYYLKKKYETIHYVAHTPPPPPRNEKIIFVSQ